MPAKMSKPVQMKAAGGLVYRSLENEIEILLIYRNGAWDLPKGKVEEGESIPGCAVREVMEEVGSSSEPVIKANLGTTEHTYTQDNVEIEKETFWFVMNFADSIHDFKPQAAEGISKVEWVSAVRAEEIVGYQNLKDLIQKFRVHLV
jgi:8-oxo-dGTP pyrophosphatase MutT (NUDIX family)